MKRRKTLAAGLGISLGIYLAGHGAVGAVCWLIIAAAGVFLLLSVRGYSHAVTLFFLFAVLGVCLMNVNIEAYHSRDVNNQTVTVSGIMTDTENVLRNCEIDGEDVPGKIEITLPYSVKNNKKITTGSEVFFLCKLGDYTVDKDGIRTTEYKNGLRYYTTEMLSEVAVTTEHPPALDERVRMYAKDMLTHYFSPESAGIAYATLFGDRSMMSDETDEAFSATGVSHIFSVSGLHVGFIVVAVNLFVKKRKKLSLAITMLAAMFYAYLCGFAASMLRAVIMTGTLLTVRAYGREPDFLSSICLAFTIILTAKPFYLYDIGFQMSVGAVLGMCFITAGIDRLMADKNKAVRKLVSSVGVSVGATLGTAPFMAQYFGDVSLIGILFNVIVIPVVSVIFILLLIALILPALFFILPLLSYCTDAVTAAAKYLSAVPALTLLPLGLGIFPYFVLLYTAGGHTLYKGKSVLALVCFLLLCVMYSAAYYLVPEYTDEIRFLDTEGSTFTVTTKSGERYVFSSLTDWGDYISVSDFGEELTLYLFDYSAADDNYLLRLADEKNLKLKVLGGLTNDETYYRLRAKNVIVERVREEDNGEVKIHTLEYITKTLAVTVEMKGHGIIWLPPLTEFQTGYVTDNTDGDVYVCSNNAAEILSAKPDAIVINKEYSPAAGVYSAHAIGNFTFTFFNGKMFFNK